MSTEPLPLLTLRDLGRAVLRWSAQWVYIARLAAQIMAWALSPGSYPRALRPVMARHLYQSAGPSLLWYVLMFGLFSLVLVQIVVVSAQSYGLSRYALEMVVRVLVLELIPLAAALFGAVNATLPMADELATLRRRGQFDALRQRGLDPLATLVLPRLLAGLFAVLLLAALSCAVTLVLAYLSAHGFSLGGFERYTRTVGRVFSPPVTLIFCAKVFLLGSAVAWIPLVTVLQNPANRRSRASAELQGLVRLFLLVLAIEAAALVGNYY